MVGNLRVLAKSELATALIAANSEDELPRSKLYIDNSDTGLILTGAVLEAAVKFRDHYLVFLTNDIPFEESLNIYYIDNNLTIIDAATLGAIYSTGHFRGLQLMEPNCVKFNFFGGTDWVVELFVTKQKHLPFFSDPKGVTRAAKLHCYFKVIGNPQPQN